MSRKSGAWLWAAGVVAGSVCAVAAAPQAGRSFPHVRTTNQQVQRALEQGLTSSPTLKSVLAEVEASDVIVHVVVEPLATGLVGSLNFVQSAGGYRYLRVSIRPDLSRLEVVAVLAHELQHASEVAHAPQIHDAASMLAFYDAVGYAVGDAVGDHYHDTDAARDVGKQVRQEVATGAVHPDLR